MKTLVNFLTILFLITFSIDIIAQIDTVYNIGADRNRFTFEELNQHLEELRNRQKSSMGDNWVLRFELINEVVENDTLVRYGSMHNISLSLLNDSDKENIRLNNKIPQFEFKDVEGELVSSKDLLGKVILINFWFTRCAPCIAEMPYLDIIKEDYKSDNIVFLSMAPEETPQVEAFLNRHEFSYRHIPDADAFMKKFGVGFPKNILVDKEGVIKYIDSGIMGIVGEVDELGNIKEDYEVQWDALRFKMDELLSN